MIRAIEAIELTTNLSKSAQEEVTEEGYSEFAMDVAANRIIMHVGHLQNSSAALLAEAEGLEIEVEDGLEQYG